MVVWISKFRRPVGLVFGSLYLAAGVARFLPGVEDVGGVLREAARANATSWLVVPSALLASHADVVTPAIGALFIGWSACLLTGRWVQVAAWSQLPVLAAFVLALFAARPQIVLIDAPFVAAALVLTGRERNAA